MTSIGLARDPQAVKKALGLLALRQAVLNRRDGPPLVLQKVRKQWESHYDIASRDNEEAVVEPIDGQARLKPEKFRQVPFTPLLNMMLDSLYINQTLNEMRLFLVSVKTGKDIREFGTTASVADQPIRVANGKETEYNPRLLQSTNGMHPVAIMDRTRQARVC